MLKDRAGIRMGVNSALYRAALGGERLEDEAGQAVTVSFRPLLYSPARAR